MLALKSKLATRFIAAAMVLSTAWASTPATAQIPPSQRYAPPAADVAPPSVHVPPANSRALRGAASYRLSDQTLRNSGDYTNYHRGVIQQTSYEAPTKTQVPDILRKPAAAMTPAAPTQLGNTVLPAVSSERIASTKPERKSPADFAASMSQVRAGSPRIAPNEMNQDKVRIEQQMAELRQKAQQRSAKATVSTSAPAVDNGLRVADVRRSAPATEATPVRSSQGLSATELVRQISAQSDSNVPAAVANVGAPRQDTNTAPDHGVSTTNGISQITERQIESNAIRQVSAETYVNEGSDASIRLDAPALSVETFGPQTIGVNKPAVYQVKVHNSSHTDAERILVGIKLPSWVDIDNVNLTAGGKEITDGVDRARVVWNIDRIPAKSSQTITVSAIPRKAEMFDVGVEWTLVPRVGKANVTVTEPRLEMNISGPKEVQFGEKAMYHVTVRNPGTGTAEKVAVMLSEALGGARASLGNIEPGKEKNFEVELLARTAGELSLVANAKGEGNLSASAERSLIVRRANLGIALQGPALKYSGSIGRYQITLTNTGDATANEVITAVALPEGVKYLGGVDSVKVIEGGVRWQVGSIDPGQTKTYAIDCQLDASGDLQLEVGARDKADLAASSACLTTVETIADLVLTVADPKGPLPTGEEIMYEINIRNRGSRSAKGINLVMQFSEGIEPRDAQGQEHQIVPGQVLFSPINQLEPGQTVSFKVNAEAFKSGTHVFRAQLTCEESDSREIAEGTTRFFGDDLQPAATATANASNSDFGSDADTNDFTR